jgi:hypothetical protein
MVDDAIMQDRASGLDLYKKYASDHDFKKAFISGIVRILDEDVA